MTFHMILVIIGAVLLQFGAFKLQKFFNDRKVKSLKTEVELKDLKIKGLEEEKKIRIREQKAGVAHRERISMSKKESKELEKKIEKAHTPDEIEEIIKLIDEDNNFRVRS